MSDKKAAGLQGILGAFIRFEKMRNLVDDEYRARRIRFRGSKFLKKNIAMKKPYY